MSGDVRLCLVMSGYVRLCSVMFGYVRLYPLIRGDARSLRLPGRFGTVCRAESGPTVRLSRAAERDTIERYGHVKEYMFVNRRWRRRLPALLGRGMADDGPSECPTGNTAGTPGSPTRTAL